MHEGEERHKELEVTVSRLKTDTVRLSADVHILTNEQTEILLTLNNLEKKNSSMAAENQALKRIIEGTRELKGGESNMPLA